MAEKTEKTGREITPFQNTVFSALDRIPAGKVTTYGDLAHLLGIQSPRAIGQALKSNPYAPKIPCHRVVRSDGTIGGYMGATRGEKLESKRARLTAEGIRFDPETGRIPEEQIIRFPAPNTEK